MTIYHASELKKQLFTYLEEFDEIDIDLSKVSELDSAGVQLLMLMKREVSQINGSLRLFSHSRAVLELFELYNLAAYFGDPLLISHDGASSDQRRSV